MTVNYLRFAHFSTYGHLSNYFIGLLFAYVLMDTEIVYNLPSVVRILLFIYGHVIMSTIHFVPALHNTFQLITPQLVPFYMIAVK